MNFEDAIKLVEHAHYMTEQDVQIKYEQRLRAIKKRLEKLRDVISDQIDGALKHDEDIKRLNFVHNALTFQIDDIKWG